MQTALFRLYASEKTANLTHRHISYRQLAMAPPPKPPFLTVLLFLHLDHRSFVHVSRLDKVHNRR